MQDDRDLGAFALDDIHAHPDERPTLPAPAPEFDGEITVDMSYSRGFAELDDLIGEWLGEEIL